MGYTYGALSYTEFQKYDYLENFVVLNLPLNKNDFHKYIIDQSLINLGIITKVLYSIAIIASYIIMIHNLFE